MRLIGLTGGTGSGKSAAGRRFAQRGIPVIDADAIGHAVIAPGGVAEAGVRGAFGDAILSEGHIDREKLAARVFGDAAALRQLNALVHPAIIGEIGMRCAAHAAEGAHAVIIDAALIAEGAELEPWLGGLILVLCPVEERVRRLVALRGQQEDDARRRIAAQSDPEGKRALATWVVENEGDLDALHKQVDRIADDIEADAG